MNYQVIFPRNPTSGKNGETDDEDKEGGKKQRIDDEHDMEEDDLLDISYNFKPRINKGKTLRPIWCVQGTFPSGVYYFGDPSRIMPKMLWEATYVHGGDPNFKIGTGFHSHDGTYNITDHRWKGSIAVQEYSREHPNGPFADDRSENSIQYWSSCGCFGVVSESLVDPALLIDPTTINDPDQREHVEYMNRFKFSSSGEVKYSFIDDTYQVEYTPPGSNRLVAIEIDTSKVMQEE
jgi:hypothetical protein